MASIKTETAASEQPKVAQAPSNPNLDMLQGMLNMVLLTAGRFIKEHQAGGGTGHMKQGMQRVVPAATDRFQDALDELENEVRLAQTVLRRDLALLKQDRKKREAAAKQHEAERARLAAESKASVPAKKEEGTVKLENIMPTTEPEAPSLAEEPMNVDAPEAQVKPEEEPAQPPATEKSNAPPAADPLFDGTPTNSNSQEHEFDFDFEFGDAMDTSGNNDNNDNNTSDMAGTSGDMDFNLGEGPSLLRGLEDYASNGNDGKNGQSANVDVDLPMPDLPELNTDSKPPVEQQKPVESTQQPAAQTNDSKDSNPVPETTDTKATVDTNDTNNHNDEPMETMTTDNLEDLFNLDDYDNPEGGDSAFNEAFFNFD